MSNEKIGIVSSEEKREIQALFERINGVQELKLILDNKSLDSQDRNLISNKIEIELPNLYRSYDNWWKKMSGKYQWKVGENKKWSINFETNEIFVIE